MARSFVKSMLTCVEDNTRRRRSSLGGFFSAALRISVDFGISAILLVLVVSVQVGGGTSFRCFFIETWDFVCRGAPFSGSSSSDTALAFSL